ncbi:hypothetical protein YC2023_087901 [Brassica napus]
MTTKKNRTKEVTFFRPKTNDLSVSLLRLLCFASIKSLYAFRFECPKALIAAYCVLFFFFSSSSFLYPLFFLVFCYFLSLLRLDKVLLIEILLDCF